MDEKLLLIKNYTICLQTYVLCGIISIKIKEFFLFVYFNEVCYSIKNKQ